VSSPTAFYKMTGSGNDFVLLDGRVEPPAAWPAERIAAVCDRRRGVGGDGLVILTPEPGNGVRFDYFNADGSRAAMCGNAALCSTRLSARLRLVEGPEMTLLTDAGPVRTRCVAAADQAELGLPDFPVPTVPEGIALEFGELALHLGTVGVPHLVVQVDDVDLVDLARRGRQLRFHPAAGPDGANANFVSPPATGRSGWRIRTFERGVEGETLACGTGTVAAAVAVAGAGRDRLPMTFETRSGEPLGVSAELSGGWARNVWLRGQGRLVFAGTLS
jgi:diaminopimelate epimerase